MRPLPSGRRASKFDRDFTSVDKLDSFSFKYIKISFATFYFSVFQCREIFYLYQIFSQKATKLLKIQHIRYVRNYRRTGNPRQTRSHPWVKSASSNFARWSESPFVHCTQPGGFVCQPLRGLVTSAKRELSRERRRTIWQIQTERKPVSYMMPRRRKLPKRKRPSRR